MNIWITDPKTNKPSVTLSAFVYGFAVASIKLFFSGMEVGSSFKMSAFSGVDFAAVLGALGMIYTTRKNRSINPDGEKND